MILMTKWLPFAILILSLGCAHNQKKSSVSSPTKNAHASGIESPKDLGQNEAIVLAEDFRTPLAEWSRKHPQATYAKLAQQVQKLIKTYGVIYYVNIKDLAPRDEKFLYFTLKDGTKLLFDTTNGSDGPCGEYYVPVSVAGFEKGRIKLLTTHGPMTLPQNPKGIYFEKTLVRKSGESSPTTFFIPNSELPWSVSPDAKYVGWKYDVRMSLVESWWRGLTRRLRDLREERPFVLIRITQENFVVETYYRALTPGQYEQVQADTDGILRYSFKPRGVTVDLSPGCH